MNTARFTLIDVFTDTPLAGNQLAVFTDARAMSDEQMQAYTRELGFSECVFVLPPREGGHVRVRIFTPECEVPFAGHPVLGAAFVVGMPLQLTLIKIETERAVVPVLLQREGAKIVFGTMSQPVPSVRPFERAEELLAALGLEGSELPIEAYDNGIEHIYVTLPTFEDVAALRPDFARLSEIAGVAGVNCFATQTEADGTVSAKTRMFAVGMGPLEDAATGSAAGPLAAHLCRHGRLAWETDIEISQGAEVGRPSTLVARAAGTADALTAIEVGGSAVAVARGEFNI